MKRATQRIWLLAFAASGATTPWVTAAYATDIKPAAERSVPDAGRVGNAGHAGANGRGGVREGEGAGTPTIRGPKLPEALRLRLQARLDARVDADVAREKALRAE